MLVGTGASAFQSAVQFPVTGRVQTGQGIKGQVLFANRTGAIRTVRLELTVSHAYATIIGGAIQVPSGSPAATPFTISVAGNSPVGPAWFQVKVVDAATGTVYSAATLNVTVTSPPGFVAKYNWAIVGVLIVLLLGVLLSFLRWRKRRGEHDVRGLYVVIRRDGELVGSELKAPGKWADTFRFVIRDESEPNARLDYPSPDDEPYTARRGRTGQVKVQTPVGERYDIAVGSFGEPLPSGLQLAFRDAKRRWTRPSPEEESASFRDRR